MTKEKNYYEILGVDINASAEQIKQAYFKQIKKYHPDTFDGDKNYAEQITANLNIAYGILSDSEKKYEYDQKLGFNKTKPKPKKQKPNNQQSNKQNSTQNNQKNTKQQKADNNSQKNNNKTKENIKANAKENPKAEPKTPPEQERNLKEKRFFDCVIIILLLLIIALLVFKI